MMKAAVLGDNGKLTVETIAIPEPGPGEVRIKLVATGVCHTDLSVIQGGFPAPTPIVLGHEGAGVVDAVGDRVCGIAAGDHVISHILVSCGECLPCVAGRIEHCDTAMDALLSGTMLDGASRLMLNGRQVHHFFCQSSFAEYCVVPARAVAVVDSEVPLDVVCLLGCGAATGIGAVTRRARVMAGSGVAIVGAGGVGMAATLAARLVGAYPIIVGDINSAKLELARAAGATHTIDMSEQDFASEVAEITAGGADYAFDAVGVDTTLTSAFAACRPGGTTVAIGLMNLFSSAQIDGFGLLQQKVLTGTTGGSIVPSIDIPKFVSLYKHGRLDLDLLVSRSYRLEQLTDAFDDMRQGSIVRGVIRFD